MVRALVVPRHGRSDVLQVQDRPVGEPGPGELLLRPAASGVNFIEVYQRQGIYPTEPPFVLGGEGAGTVEAVGADVSEVAVGDMVAWTSIPGSHADLVVGAASSVVPVPSGVSAEQAAAVLLQGLTAHYLVHSTFPIRAGQAALVHAAAGGVGQLLVQMIAEHGATVIATASTDEKIEKARSLGAAAVIRYDEVSDLAAAVREANGGRGVDVVYDGVGRSTFEASLAALDRRGMLVLFGAASGPVPPVDPQRLNSAGSLYLTRPTLGDYVATREELLWRAGEVLGAVADGSLQVSIGGRYPLEDAARAYDDLENRRSTGKLLLTR